MKKKLLIILILGALAVGGCKKADTVETTTTMKQPVAKVDIIEEAEVEVVEEEATEIEIISELEEEVNIEVVKKEKEYTKGDAEYWIDKTEGLDVILMDKDSIEKFNKENYIYSKSLVDIKNYKENIKKSEIVSLIKEISVPEKGARFNETGKIISESDYENLERNLNIKNIPENVISKYGVIVNRTILRKYPTAMKVTKQPGKIEFDRFAETAVYPAEPVLILSESADKNWLFIQMYNYSGWVNRSDIAVGSKAEIFNFVEKEPFIIIKDSQINVMFNAEDKTGNTLLDMGVRLPVKNNANSGEIVVVLPVKDKDGKLKLLDAKIDDFKSVNLGYLDYTKENIIKQAFKMKNVKFGWGGVNNGRDCSAMIMDIYRTFGINLPRNSMDQGKNSLGKVFILKDSLGLEERKGLLSSLQPGTLLYLKGHIMMYIGMENGEHQAIHVFTGYYETDSQGNKRFKEVMKVDVTPMTIKFKNGKTFLEKAYGIKEFTN